MAPVFLFVLSVAASAQTKAACIFQVFQLPESTSSVPYGINDYGTVVGSAVYSTSGFARGFVRYADGMISYYNVPNGGNSYPGYSYFVRRNERGVSAGTYKENRSVPQGFILNGSTFTSITAPNSVWGTTVIGINNWNDVVGFYQDYQSHTHGFKRSSNGGFLTLDYPNAQSTFPSGINDNGVIVGSYSGGHGFIYRGGEWATLDYPKATGTTLNGTSNAGVIIGHAFPTKQGISFLYVGGAFKVISVPNSVSTNANGISAEGLITGTTNLDGSAAGLRGFTASCR